jgi:hypothetical protein
VQQREQLQHLLEYRHKTPLLCHRSEVKSGFIQLFIAAATVFRVENLHADQYRS